MEASRRGFLEAVTVKLSSAVTEAQVLEAVVEEASRALETSAALASVVSRRGGDEVATPIVHRGASEALARTLEGAALSAKDPFSQSLCRGAPVWVSNREALVREFPEFERAMAGALGAEALAALPLRVGGAVVAGLGLTFPEVHAFDERERSFLIEVASRCEGALERARHYEESRAARAELEALVRSHEIVAGILAHDLKNPLSAVLMNARMLRDAETDRTRGIGRRILTSGERMARMIDQILEWTRLRAGGLIALERAACDLRGIIDEVVTELRARKPESQIRVEANGDLNGHWDGDRLAQVVSNLVGNAVDHASRPGVSVIVDGRADDVRLSVANEGRIDEQLLATIFEPFHGRERGTRHRGRGLGLGLFITRQIVAAHGGRVELAPATDAADHRVTFIVTLPRAR